MIEQYPCVDEMTWQRYKKVPVHAPGVRNGETGKEWRGKLPPKGKHWQYTPEKLDALDEAGEIYWSLKYIVTLKSVFQYKIYG